MNLIKVCLLQCKWYPLVKCCQVPLHFYSSTRIVLFYRSDYTYSCGIIWFVWTQTLQTVNSKNNETLSAFFPIRCFSSVQFSSVQSLSRVQLFAAPWISAHQASLSITNSQRSLKLTSIELVMPSSHLIPGPSPPAPNLSQHQGLFKWVNSSCEVAKVLEFQLQHQSFQWTRRTDLL